MRTHDCAPTLTDTEVLEFCKAGFLVLPGVVSDDVNRRATEWCNERNRGIEPSDLLDEEWFVEGVLLNSAAAGAVRSLLGPRFGLPLLVSNHRIQLPAPSQPWHRDGGSVYSPEVNYLQVFYYPQETPESSGPTELIPGSHFLYSHAPWMAHYDAIRNTYLSNAPAGSIFLTMYNIWHRRSASAPDASGVRNLLKYNYWRLSPSARDWLPTSGFDLETADYSSPWHPTYREQFRESFDAAEMFFWLCGQQHQYRRIGGQGWPMPAHTYEQYQVRERPGYPLPRSRHEG
jgi:hypothetical protein